MIQLIRDLIIFTGIKYLAKIKSKWLNECVVLQIVTSEYQIIIIKNHFSFFSKSAYTNIIVLQKKIPKVIAKTVIMHAIDFSLNNCYKIIKVLHTI